MIHWWPTDDPPTTHLENFKWRHICNGSSDELHMFGSRLGFSGSADRMALFPVWSNPRGGQRPPWKVSNGHISTTGHRSSVGFSGSADHMVSTSDWTKSKRQPHVSWKISNEYISGYIPRKSSFAGIWETWEKREYVRSNQPGHSLKYLLLYC